MTKSFITGIRPTGQIHLGHYCSLIKPIELGLSDVYKDLNKFFMIANLHSLVSSNISKQEREEFTIKLAAAFLSFNFSSQSKCFIYLQSDINGITDLAWIISNCISKSTLDRCHAIKNMDSSTSASLFNYPLLMSSDIIGLQANYVLASQDQHQHIEIARKSAIKLNQYYGFNSIVPDIILGDSLLIGTDGRKMSKSYNNTIPIFEDIDVIRDIIFKIPTNSQQLDEPKDINNNLMYIYSSIADKESIDQLILKHKEGISWNQVKQILFEQIINTFAPYRQRYQYLISNDMDIIFRELSIGKNQVQEITYDTLNKIKQLIGLLSF